MGQEGDFMSARNLQAIVLAAGKSTRFRTEKTKLIEKICGQEMVLYVTKNLENIGIHTTVVVGHQRETIKKVLKKHHEENIEFVIQEEQKGTGHALLCAQSSFKKDDILILNADIPLVTKEIIEELYKQHIQTKATLSFVTSYISDPASGAYGKVIKNDNHIQIVEAKDFTENMDETSLINAGIYIVKKSFLEKYISQLKSNNGSQEFYVTDLIKIACENDYTVTTISAPFDHIRGINTFKELWIAEQIKRSEIIRYWMDHGVRFSLAQSVHIDKDVEIEAGTFIDCSVHLLHGTKIGKNCTIQGFSTLSKAQVGNNTTVYPHSIIDDSIIGNNTKIGPFACVHEKSTVGDNSIIGNFVEVRKSKIGNQSTAKHLTYLANSKIGSQVTIGAGTITCNHDGQQYKKTTVEDNVFIASNNSLVAPVIIAKNTSTEPGSVITNEVTDQTCSICAVEQTVTKSPRKIKKSENEPPKIASVTKAKHKQKQTTL